MSVVLAIDTATQVSSVAVASETRLFAELTMQARLTHSETLLPHIEQVLKMANVKKEDLDGLAVSLGPGSFTGLRIGLAAAKAICYALKLPLIGVPTLEALAWHYPVPGVRVMTLLDAQKGNAYRQSFCFQEGHMEAMDEITVAGLREVAASCSEMNGPVVLRCGAKENCWQAGIAGKCCPGTAAFSHAPGSLRGAGGAQEAGCRRSWQCDGYGACLYPPQRGGGALGEASP